MTTCVLAEHSERDINCKPQQKEETTTVRKQVHDKMSVLIPRSRLKEQLVERLVELGEKRDRSVNYLVIEAIFDYLKREETKN